MLRSVAPFPAGTKRSRGGCRPKMMRTLDSKTEPPPVREDHPYSVPLLLEPCPAPAVRPLSLPLKNAISGGERLSKAVVAAQVFAKRI